MTTLPAITQRSLISRISIGVMYAAISLCLLVWLYTTLTSRVGGYNEAEVGISLFYGILMSVVFLPSGVIGLIASIAVLAQERKRRSIHAWIALLLIATESVFIILYILPLFAPAD